MVVAYNASTFLDYWKESDVQSPKTAQINFLADVIQPVRSLQLKREICDRLIA